MKRALIVGINYTGTGSDLRGCINDATNMNALLKERGFDQIKLVLEKEATTAGIIAGLEWLIADATPGDVLVFHYSGHGSQLPSKVEADGFEEIICPYDLNWRDKVITDDTLRSVFNRVPNGVNTTLILDCCHSGTALDQAGSLEIQREISLVKEGRYLAPPADVVAELADRELVDWTTSRDVNASALLIAGCHASQTSADAFIDGTYQGAATASLLKAVRANPSISYEDLVMEMNAYMIAKGFKQIPQLDGFRGLYAEQFIEPWGSGAVPDDAVPVTPAPAPAPTPAPAPAPVQPEPKKDNGPMIIIIAIVVAIAAFFLASN